MIIVYIGLHWFEILGHMGDIRLGFFGERRMKMEVGLLLGGEC
jgi:hypothetical protein